MPHRAASVQVRLAFLLRCVVTAPVALRAGRSATAYRQNKKVWQPLEQHCVRPEHGLSLVQRHWPAVHRLLLLPQELPQRPQLLKSSDRLLQVPLQHVWPELHTVPHAPQFDVLARRSTQLPPQQVCPLPQSLLLSHMQRPPRHTKLAGQAWPQAPQCWVLLVRFASQPLLALPSQLP
jgi:hypothetical protein